MNKFSADQFVPTRFSTAADKARFANHLLKFIDGGFKRQQFPKWFYNRLSQTFGNIAEGSQDGFYATWFSNPDRQSRFLNRLAEYSPVGQAEHTFSDVEYVIVGWARTRTMPLLRPLDITALLEKNFRPPKW